MPRNAKTKAASSGRFKLDPSSSRATFLCCPFFFSCRFTWPAPIFPVSWLDPSHAVTVPQKPQPPNPPREIMLFIGKPMGRSIMISNPPIYVPIQDSRTIPVSCTWHSSFLPDALAAVNKAWICFAVTVRSLWTQHEACYSLKKKSAPPGPTAFHSSVCWCILETQNPYETSVCWCMPETPNTTKMFVRWCILETRKRGRRLGIAVAENAPTASFLTKIGKLQSAGCRLCRIAREARGENTDGLPAETHGHINSAGCEGMTTTVMATNHSIWRHLYDSIHASQKPKSKLKFVTLDKESNIKTL